MYWEAICPPLRRLVHSCMATRLEDRPVIARLVEEGLVVEYVQSGCACHCFSYGSND